MDDPFVDQTGQYQQQYSANGFLYNQAPPQYYGPPPPMPQGYNFGGPAQQQFPQHHYAQQQYPRQQAYQQPPQYDTPASAIMPYHAPAQSDGNRSRAGSQFGTRPTPPAVPEFECRNDIGHPTMPRFLILPNYNAAVLHVTQNPFIVRPNEVLVCLGNDASLVEYPQASGIYGIHIIQERMTGKTMDIYVELTDFVEADKAFRRYSSLAQRGREPKLGNRRIKLEMSTMTALMKAIFPRAKCQWENGMPVRSEAYMKEHNAQWDGFITREELVKVQLFAEQPQSSKTRFAVDSPERVYEFMMTSIQKIPWNANRAFFPKDWIHALNSVLMKMSLRLANLVREQNNITLDSKLLTQWMKTLHCCPMYACGDITAMENYMKIAKAVDNIMSSKFNRVNLGLISGGMGNLSLTNSSQATPSSRRRSGSILGDSAKRPAPSYSTIMSGMPANGYGTTSTNSSYRSALHSTMMENVNPADRTNSGGNDGGRSRSSSASILYANSAPSGRSKSTGSGNASGPSEHSAPAQF